MVYNERSQSTFGGPPSPPSVAVHAHSRRRLLHLSISQKNHLPGKHTLNTHAASYTLWHTHFLSLSLSLTDTLIQQQWCCAEKSHGVLFLKILDLNVRNRITNPQITAS